MAFDFPASPTVGQIFTDPPTGVTYEWDGQAWMRKQDAAPVTLIPRKETAMSDPTPINQPVPPIPPPAKPSEPTPVPAS